MARLSSGVRAGPVWLVALFFSLCTSCGGNGVADEPGGGNGPPPPGGTTGDLILSAQVTSSPPANISVLFEATDSAGAPVAGLLTEGRIELLENGERVSPFESRQRIQPIGRQIAFPTLLLLDLSGSIVRSGNLPQLKASAREFVATLLDPSTPNATAREIAVAYFPGSSTGRGIRIVSDFSTDIAAIQADIDAIRGAPDTTTNLNEAILRGLEALDAREQDLLNRTEVELTEGSLAVFTDGTDRAGTVDTESVLTELQDTDNGVFTIGLQGEIDEAILREFGRSGFVLVEDIQNLRQVFQNVAGTIRAAANRFYAVEYCSPKRGGEHDLTVVAKIGESEGSTTVRFDAAAFRAGCRVPEGAVELTGASDARFEDIAFDAFDGGFVACGSIRDDGQWFGRGISAGSGSDALVTHVVPPTDDGTPPVETWTVLLRSGGDAIAHAVAAPGDGSTWVGGEFTRDLAIGGLNLGGNGTSPTGFVAALAESGAPLWARAFTGSGVQRVRAVAQRGDGVLVLGEFSGDVSIDGNVATSAGGLDIFIADFDLATGVCRWLRSEGGNGEERPRGLAVSPADGSFLITGSFSGSTTLGGVVATASGTSDGFVLRTEGNRTPLWARTFGGGGDDSASAVIYDIDGQPAVVGDFDATFRLDGTEIVPAGPSRSGVLLRFARASGVLSRSTVIGDAATGLATRTTDIAEDGIGNLYLSWSQTLTGQPAASVLGFAMVVPSGERLLDYTYSTDAALAPSIAIGPLGLDQACFAGSFARSATFGPFPLRYEEPFAPGAPLGGVNAFLGFVGPRS